MVASNTAALLEHARELKTLVDSALDRYTQFGRGCPETLREAIRHSLLAPGKRLRPLLVLMAAEACGCPVEKAMPAACAVEMVHTYSLIHDDLPAMDDDDLRRGLPSCHAKYGEANAILAGDALLALAFEVLTLDVDRADCAARCCRELAHASGATELVGGQADDLASEQMAGTLEHLESIHSRKTGAIFRVSLRLGGIVAGVSDSDLEKLDQYGEKLGLAFQIVDDLLDLKGNELTLGKRAQKDSEHGKLTFPSLLGVEESERRAEALINEACAAVAQLGTNASGLESLARYVLERNH